MVAVPVSKDSRLAAVLDRFGTLANDSVTAGRLLTATTVKDPDIVSVKRIIEAEAGLTLRVLRVANSAFYGQARTIGSIDRAISVLGIEGVSTVAAAACLDNALPRTAATKDVSAALHQHCLCCGISSQILAQSVAPSRTGEAFIAGLLHDIGCGVLMQVDGAAFIELSERRWMASQAGRSLDMNDECLDERRRFGATSVEASLLLLDRWRLPEWIGTIVEAALEVQPTDGNGRDALADCLRWANALATELGCANAFESGLFRPVPSDRPIPPALRTRVLDEAPRAIAALGSLLLA